MKKTLLLATLIGSLCSAQAAVDIRQSALAPTQNLIIAAEGYNDATLNWAAYGTGNAYADIGQQFIAPENTYLSAFTYFIDSFESKAPGAAFTIKIFQTANPTVALQNTDVISTQFGTLPTDLTAQQFITFKLEEQVELIAGLSYTVMLHFDEVGTGGAGSRRIVKFAIGTVNGQNPLGSSTGFWRTTDFTNYYKDAKIMTSYFQTEAIPEPSTTALVIGAGLLLAFKARPRVLQGRFRRTSR